MEFRATLLCFVALCSTAVCNYAGSLEPRTTRSPELLLSVSGELPCQEHNSKLNAWIRKGVEETGGHLVPHRAKDLDSFALEVKAALDDNMLNERPINHIFSSQNSFHPTCAGDWLEFGVASGTTVNIAARFRRTTCSPACPSVFGFDTFTGLPEQWVRDDSHTWEQNDFDQGGNDGRFPEVEDNVHLVKGLFNESIPPFLKNQAVYAGKSNVISYLHVDCDLYAGAKDIFTLLGHKIRVGTVIVFDELVNYQYFKDHEIKALWEWVSASGVKLLPIGIKGPLPGKGHAVEVDLNEMASSSWDPWDQQSAAFVVAHVPQVRHKSN